MTEPKIKVERLAYVRVSAPNLAEAETFLQEFGLHLVERRDGAVYWRGTDPDPPCYVLTQGPSNVKAIAFEAESASDLEAIARVDGASAIEALDGPAGGRVVRLRDPQGMQVEIVHGRAQPAPLETRPAHRYNMNGQRRREGTAPAIERGPSSVRRIGHLVLESADPRSVYQWYRAHLGLRKVDELLLSPERTVILFSSLDRGRNFVDHHVVGFQFSMDEGARVQHVAFEVDNFDDLMSGHEHLKSKKRKNVWGVGRHRFGGQIFDYWKSPWGVIHEHWTDTDTVNDETSPMDHDAAALEDYWGPMPTPAFVVSRWNWRAARNVARMLLARSRAGRP